MTKDKWHNIVCLMAMAILLVASGIAQYHHHGHGHAVCLCLTPCLHCEGADDEHGHDGCSEHHEDPLDCSMHVSQYVECDSNTDLSPKFIDCLADNIIGYNPEMEEAEAEFRLDKPVPLLKPKISLVRALRAPPVDC